MMYKFRKNWFAPSESIQVNQVYKTSGRIYKKDREYDLDEATIAVMPKDLAYPIDKKGKAVAAVPYKGLKEYDEARDLDEAVTRRLKQITDANHSDDTVVI
jgi:hypothetical protein